MTYFNECYYFGVLCEFNVFLCYCVFVADAGEHFHRFDLWRLHRMATIPITKRGAEKLKTELHRLKTVERPAVITAIAEARAQGDLSENADYDAAKDRQGFIEGRIQEIEGKLHEILFDDVFCNEVARQCYERASAFSWHNSAKMYYEVFHRFAK